MVDFVDRLAIKDVNQFHEDFGFYPHSVIYENTIQAIQNMVLSKKRKAVTGELLSKVFPLTLTPLPIFLYIHTKCQNNHIIGYISTTSMRAMLDYQDNNIVRGFYQMAYSNFCEELGMFVFNMPQDLFLTFVQLFQNEGRRDINLTNKIINKAQPVISLKALQ